jgi:hypothetical protein
MPVNEPKPARNAPLWIKIWLPLHIIAITAWSLPYAPASYRDSPNKFKIKGNTLPQKMQSSAEMLRNGFLYGNEKYVKNSPLKQYLLFTGFWQYWDMFSPNPASVDNYATIVVNYANGAKKNYPYPRIYDLPLHEKFMKERWRKFFERAGTGEFSFLWKPFGNFVALSMFDDPKNPPVSVELHRHQLVIAPPGKPVNTEYSDELYYTVFIDQAELRRKKGF